MKSEHKKLAVNEKLLLSECKPDIEFILRITTTPMIEKVQVRDKQVSLEGHLFIFVEYAACTSECTQLVHFMLPFSSHITSCRARDFMSVQLNTMILFQEFDFLNPRAISMKSIVEITILKLGKMGDIVPGHNCQPFLNLCKPVRPLTCIEQHCCTQDKAPPPAACQPNPPAQCNNWQPENYSNPMEPHHYNHCDNPTCTICGCHLDGHEHSHERSPKHL